MTPPMTLRAGRCSRCQTLLWRTCTQQTNWNGATPDEEIILWPSPSSLYVKARGANGSIPGLAFCSSCVPDLGDVVDVPDQGLCRVIAIEAAASRYSTWYDRRDFYQAWLHDQAGLDEVSVQHLMDVFDMDCVAIGAPSDA